MAVSIRLIKKARDAGDSPHVASLSNPLSHPRDVSLGYPLIGLQREEEGHVDIDAFTDELLDSRDAFRRGRNLDQDIGPPDGLPETPCLFECPGGVPGEVWETSKLTYPSRCFDWSYTTRNSSAAS